MIHAKNSRGPRTKSNSNEIKGVKLDWYVEEIMGAQETKEGLLALLMKK